MKVLKSLLQSMFDEATCFNAANILSLLDRKATARVLDLGCDDGTWTLRIANAIGTKEIFGVDIVYERIQAARAKGIYAVISDLNHPLPFRSNSFDCVHANQVIEHLFNTDLFIREIYRVLRRGGYCIISTENLASWCNIASLVFGWQPFSQTNITSVKAGIGNPLALHRGEPVQLKSWLHVRVVAVSALIELFTIHGFHIERVVGAGYFPLPAVLGRIDVRHSHFITIKARKLFG